MQQIAIVNSSKRIADSDALYMTAACNYQVVKHLAPLWGFRATPVAYYPSGIVPRGAWVIELVDEIPEAPGALGYHTEEGDIVSGRIGISPVLDNGGVALYNPAKPTFPTVSSVLSHEVCETICDAFVNEWCDGPAIAEGSGYAKESADPVESDSYEVQIKGVTVSVSNFVTPKYFDPQATVGPFDFLHRLSAPFSLAPGGYMVVRGESGTPQEVFAQTKPPEWRLAMKRSVWARTALRCGTEKAAERMRNTRMLLASQR